MRKIYFTNHAIDRFVQRHAPELSRDDARRFLQDAAQSAVRLRDKTIKGDVQWELDDPAIGERIILVTKSERDEEVCVTVLPSPRADMLAEAREIFEEHRAAIPAPPPTAMALSKKAMGNLVALRCAEASKVKQVEITRRHAETLRSNAARSALREVMRFVRDRQHLFVNEAGALFNKVAEFDSYFASNEFIDGPRQEAQAS